MHGGILGIWVDCEVGREAEFEDWYNRQHLGERVGVAGFVSGARYVALRGKPAYLTVYRTRGVDVLQSPAYLERQNNPTEWTRRSLPLFRNTVRTVFACTARAGQGHGGIVATVRFGPKAKRADELARWLGEEAVPRLAAAAGMVRAELWQVDREATGGPTVENTLRPSPDLVADWAVVAEGTTASQVDAALAAVLPAAAMRERGAGPQQRGLYRYLFGLVQGEPV